MNVLNFKNRIRELRDNITDDNIKNLCNKYVVNFDNSQKNVNLIREVLLNSINDYLPNLTNKNDIDKISYFIKQEKSFSVVENLGIKELLDKISDNINLLKDSVLLKSKFDYYNHNINNLAHYEFPEYIIYENFINDFKNITIISEFKDYYENIIQNVINNKDDIAMFKFIYNYQNNNEFLYEHIVKDVLNYVIIKDKYRKKVLLEKLSGHLYDSNIKTLYNMVLENDDKGFVLFADNDNAVTIKDVYSPVANTNEGMIFYVKDKYYKIKNNRLFAASKLDVSKSSENFISLCNFINEENVDIKADCIKIYDNKKVYILKENKDIILNDNKISYDTLVGDYFRDSVFDAKDSQLKRNIINLYENYNMIQEINICKKIVSNLYENRWIDIFYINGEYYINKHDKLNNDNVLLRRLNAKQVKNIVLEYLGYDISNSILNDINKEDNKLMPLRIEMNIIKEKISLLESKRDNLNAVKEDSDDYRASVDTILDAINVQINDLKEKYLILKNKINETEEVEEIDDDLRIGSVVRLLNGKVGTVISISDVNNSVNVKIEDDNVVVNVPSDKISELEIIDNDIESDETYDDDNDVELKTDDKSVDIIESATNDKWVDGNLIVKGKSIPVLVNALDYTNSASDDLITIKYSNGKIDKVIKSNVIIKDILK